MISICCHKRVFRYIVLLLLLLLVLTGCGNASEHESHVKTEDPDLVDQPLDDQYYLGPSGNRLITEGENVYYFAEQLSGDGEDGLQGYFLCYLEKATLKTGIMCIRANCLHQQEKDYSQFTSCGGYILNPRGMWFHCGNLYIVCTDNTELSQVYETVLKVYKPDGTFVRNETVLPNGVQTMIMHKGKLYYSHVEVTETGIGVYGVNQYDLETKDTESVGLWTEDQVEYVGNFLGYGDYVYFLVSEKEGKGFTHRVAIYRSDEQTLDWMENPVSPANMSAPLIYQDRLLVQFWKYKEDGTIDEDLYRKVFCANPDGSNVEEIGTVQYPGGVIAAFEDMLLVSNRAQIDVEYDPQTQTFYATEREKFAVYRDLVLQYEFDLASVAGRDFSTHEIERAMDMDPYIVLKTYGGTRAVATGGATEYEFVPACLIAIQKETLKTGRLDPVVIELP